MRMKIGGADRNRTDDLYSAIVALFQLSYSPIVSTDKVIKFKPPLRSIAIAGSFREKEYRSDDDWGKAVIERSFHRQECLRHKGSSAQSDTDIPVCAVQSHVGM